MLTPRCLESLTAPRAFGGVPSTSQGGEGCHPSNPTRTHRWSRGKERDVGYGPRRGLWASSLLKMRTPMSTPVGLVPGEQGAASKRSVASSPSLAGVRRVCRGLTCAGPGRLEPFAEPTDTTRGQRSATVKSHRQRAAHARVESVVFRVSPPLPASARTVGSACPTPYATSAAPYAISFSRTVRLEVRAMSRKSCRRTGLRSQPSRQNYHRWAKPPCGKRV
jgi:hypothetical protein